MDLNTLSPSDVFRFTVGFMIVEFLVEMYIDGRQHLRLRNRKRPEPLSSIVSEKDFSDSQVYGETKSRFHFLTAALSFVETMCVLWFGGIPWLWARADALRVANGSFGLATEGSELTACIFLVGYVLYSTVRHLPEGLYSTFVIEERFGFNKTDLKTFFLDKVKGLGLTFLIGLPILYVALIIIRWGGESFYLYVWAFLTLATVILIAVYPAFIAPCFNTYTELTEGELYDAIAKLCEKVAFPSRKVFVVDGSKRSSHSNAYFYGFFGVKRIVIYDTLIKDMTTEEIVAILGHELGHYRMNHVLKNFVVSQSYLFCYLYLFSAMVHKEIAYTAFGLDVSTYGKPAFIGFVLFGLISNSVDVVMKVAMNWLSRTFEYQADAFAVKLGFDLQGPLTKLFKENKGNWDPDPLYSMWHHTHPTLLERIDAMKPLRKARD